MAAEKAATAGIPFTAEFPKVQDLAGSGAYTVSPQCTTQVQACIRDYLIHAPGGKAYPIYIEVFSNGQLGQFYDVQGTTWVNAPLFADPNQTVHVGKRTYFLYYDGSQLSTVAWSEYGAMYWVHNTLTDAVDNGELLAIAEQTTPISGVVSTGAGRARQEGRQGDTEPTRRRRADLDHAHLEALDDRDGRVDWRGGGAAALPLLLFGVLRRRRQLRPAASRAARPRRPAGVPAGSSRGDPGFVGRDSRPAACAAARVPAPGCRGRVRRLGGPVYPPPGPPVYPPPGVAARPPVAAPTRPPAGAAAGTPAGPAAGTPPPATAAARRRIRV